jgi:hypothetical protein
MNYSEPDRVKPSGEFDGWEIEIWSILAPLKNAVNSALWLSTPEAALATGDQLRAIARESTKWQLNHHCLFPDLAVSFRRVIRSSTVLADVLLGEAQNPGGADWPAITREVTGMHKLVEQFVGLMNAHATRASSDPG